MTFTFAELRSWVKTIAERDTFQGYINNDEGRNCNDGKFVTIEADEVIASKDGYAVYVKNKVYYLWNGFKRGAE